MALPASDHTAPPGGEVQDRNAGALAHPVPTASRREPWHVRYGVGWSSDTPPVILLVLIGLALGPQALAVLTAPVLQSIDPALPVALAALGAHLALNLPVSSSTEDRRLMTAAGIEAVITGAAVTLGVLFLVGGNDPDSFHAWLLALAAGVCAATSSALPSDRSSEVQTRAVRARNLDVVFAVIAGGLLLAWSREGFVASAVLLAIQAVLIALVIAVAGWLLLGKVTSETEQRILSAAALLLVGGLADYLSLSAILSGLVAGTFWRLAGGPARESLRRDISYVLHPLLVLMLVVAGARTDLGLASLALLAAYPVLRAAGKLLGGFLARRLTGPVLEDRFGSVLIHPGLFGIAFAMSTIRSAGPQTDSLLVVVVIGTVATQFASALRGPEQHA
jgi:hypothetical protein